MLPVLNIARTLALTALQYPDRTGLEQGELALRWSELDRRVSAFAAAMRHLGVRRGDHVFVLTPNNPAAFETMYSVARIGAVNVPVNFRATAAETTGFADRCQPVLMIVIDTALDCAAAACEAASSLKAVVVIGDPGDEGRARGWQSYEDLIRAHIGAQVEDVPVTHDEPYRINFSAGSTGTPKAVVNTFGQIAYTLVNRLADIMPGTGPDDALLAIGPLSHGTSTAVYVNVARGARTVMLTTPRFDEAECWDLIERKHITSLFLVPTMLMRLVLHPSAAGRNVARLRHVVYAGAPISRENQKRAIALLGHALVQYYGSGESLGHGTVLRPEMHTLDDADPGVGSVGVPRCGTDLCIMDENMRPLPTGATGMVCIRRGPGTFGGYLGDPEASASAFRDDWLLTGDLGFINDHGHLFISGRTKEMYKSGGMQVYPRETEECLASHPSVADAYVLAFPDSQWGEAGLAIVRPMPGQQPGEDALKEHLRQSLAAYKIPRRILVWSDVPATSIGKVLKPVLREELYARGALQEGKDIPAPPEASS